MYVPPAFREEDLPTIHSEMRKIQLATLVTQSSGGLVATHLPLFLDATEGKYGTLHGHLARANEQWSTGLESVEALAIFTGPDAYVTPSWYPSMKESGKVVPTWIYVAIHAYGRARFSEDPTLLREIITRLTDIHEAASPTPWQVNDAPADYIDAQLKRIVAVTIPISRLEGKWKFDQRSSEQDRLGVIAGLRAQGGRKEEEAADIMENFERSRTRNR